MNDGPNRTRARLIPLSWILLAALVLGMSGCAALGKDAQQAATPDLQVPELTTSIGRRQGDTDEQVFSYTVYLQNTSEAPIHVKWIEPLLSEPFSPRVLSSDPRLTVDATLAAQEGREISGELVFDAQGLTKDQILALEPFMSGINVASERVLALPGP
jgi:hypothetical protein